MISSSVLKLYYEETSSKGNTLQKSSNILKLNPLADNSDILSLGEMIGNVQEKTFIGVSRVDETKLS